MEIVHEIISTAILLPSADSRRVVVSYKPKHVHKVLVNRLFKLAQEKRVGSWTDRPNMTIAVDLEVKNQTKQTKQTKLIFNSYCAETEYKQFKPDLYITGFPQALEIMENLENL